MASDVVVPALGESISEATVLEWLVNEGEAVSADQELVSLETDKITVNVPAPSAGVLIKHVVSVGDDVEVGAVIAQIDPNAVASEAAPTASTPDAKGTPPAAAAAPAPVTPAPVTPAPAAPQEPSPASAAPLMPAVRRLIAEHGLKPSQIKGSGKGGRILKGDVLAFIAAPESSAGAPKAPAPAAPPVAVKPASAGERIVPMSKLRRRIAENLVAAQHEAAMLTTFNEVDMSAVMALRKTYQERFKARYDIKLGFTSFFVKAVIEGLKAFPAVNAEIRGDDLVYKDFFHIGVAVGGGRGLVVPVIRDADRLSFAGIEQSLGDLAMRARSNKLTMADLQGGTFTISNGGVYGSMLSTPILNRPQSGILGLHNIQQRPVAIDGQVVIRPMMFLALTYDHRIIDGREAVSFLVRVKEAIEDPQRILIEV